MPVKPRKDETKPNFIQRCVGVEVSSGREQAQAVAICYSIWKKHRRKKDGLTESP